MRTLKNLINSGVKPFLTSIKDFIEEFAEYSDRRNEFKCNKLKQLLKNSKLLSESNYFVTLLEREELNLISELLTLEPSRFANSSGHDDLLSWFVAMYDTWEKRLKFIEDNILC